MELLQRLGVEYPIFLAPMAGVSTPKLVAAVSNAGGLGSLGLGAHTPQAAQETIRQTKALTARPFQVNFFCHRPEPYNEQNARAWTAFLRAQFARYGAEPPRSLRAIYGSFVENDDFLDVVLAERPAAVSFHFGLPQPHQIQALKAAGVATLVSVTQLSEALAAQSAGIDAVVAQGVEAGGHRGMFCPHTDPGISAFALTALLKKRIGLPVVCAGGIMNGGDVAQAVKWGAAAAQLGTAFVQCAESAAAAAYREALFAVRDTQISDSLSGRPARGLLNRWHETVDLPERPPHAGYPYTYDLAKQLHQAAAQCGDNGFGAFWAGSGVGQIRRMDADELMRCLIEEWRQAAVAD